MVIIQEFISQAFEHDKTIFDHVRSVADGEGLSHVLFHQENGNPFLVYLFNNGKYLLNQDGCQACGGQWSEYGNPKKIPIFFGSGGSRGIS
jgi:hypothetical protein